MRPLTFLVCTYLIWSFLSSPTQRIKKANRCYLGSAAYQRLQPLFRFSTRRAVTTGFNCIYPPFMHENGLLEIPERCRRIPEVQVGEAVESGGEVAVFRQS